MTVKSLQPGPLRQEKLDEARRHIKDGLAHGRKPLLAYSGGKDAIAVALLAGEFGIDVGVCEESFYFTRQSDSARSTAQKLGLAVTYSKRLGYDVLLRRPSLLFPYKRAKEVNRFAAMKQRKTFEAEAVKTGRTMVLTGRKRGGNSVKAPIYVKGPILLVHPLISWSDGDVWAWLKHNGVGVPWIYRTPYGVHEGNGTWPMYRESPDFMECWRAIWHTEEKIVREAAAHGVKGAAEAVLRFE